MTCEKPCKNCDRTGLPILFTRYAVAYSVQSARQTTLGQLQPRGHLKAKPDGVTLKKSSYNLRMLRGGYLYLRIQRSGLPVEWQGYAVHPQGYLTSFDVGFPSSAKPQIACQSDSRPANASLVWVAKVKSVQTLHYLFSPDPLNPDHLRSVINVKPDDYMQSFDAAAWANGNTSAANTCQPGQVNSQVAEFAAVGAQSVCDAFDSQLYGLMGSSAVERGWGDWQEDVTDEEFIPMADAPPMSMPVTRTVQRRGPTYTDAHGARLKQMAVFLQTQQGAVVACDDALGIAQELGHAYAEAQTVYTHWQLDQAKGQAKGVTNEWVYQTAVGAKSLHDLVKKNAIQTTEQEIKEWNDRVANHPMPVFYPDAATKAREEARHKEAIARNQQRVRDEAAKKGDAEFARLFDQAAANAIITEQGNAYAQQQKRLAELGTDQNAWLSSQALKSAIARYSAQDAHIGKPGGGAALSLQLAHCMVGMESNQEGLKLLQGMDPFGDNILARLLSFNNASVKAMLKQMDDDAQKAGTLPKAEPSTEWADTLADKVVKPYAARFGLGDKALGFMETIPGIGECAVLRKMNWPLQVATLMSVKMMQGVNKLPVTAAEAWVVRKVAVVALASQGTRAYDEVQSLARLNPDRVRNAARALSTKGVAAAANRARMAAPSARAAALGGIFDVSNAIIKGYQLGVKQDGRTAVEMVGSLLQGTGSILDWRAKAYEETVYKGIKGTDLFTAPAMSEVLDTMQMVNLKALRLTAFKFLAPAALISIYWDATDGWASHRRGQDALATAQLAGVTATIFTVIGISAGVYATGVGGSAALWGGVAATLGLIGAALAVVSVVAVLLLKEDDWIVWLRDIPLSLERKGEKPIHENLLETQKKLANAMPGPAL